MDRPRELLDQLTAGGEAAIDAFIAAGKSEGNPPLDRVNSLVQSHAALSWELYTYYKRMRMLEVSFHSSPASEVAPPSFPRVGRPKQC